MQLSRRGFISGLLSTSMTPLVGIPPTLATYSGKFQFHTDWLNGWSNAAILNQWANQLSE